MITHTDIIVLVFLVILLYIGFSAGIIKSSFAVAAGFFAVILAENYPNPIGINYYLIFFVTALAIFLAGMMISKIFKFMYLSFFDKIAGACLGLAIWLVFSANIIIPGFNNSQDKTETKIISSISNVSSKVFPWFGSYVPEAVKDFQNSKNINN